MRAYVVGLIGALLVAAPARAQQPLTRADSAAVLIGTAERLRAQGSIEMAEALARLVQRRYADTPANDRAVALLTAADQRRESRAGRVGVIAFSTLYGAWLGVAVPAMLDADDATAYGLGLLAGAPVGFFAGRAYTNGRSVTAGDAGVIAWSGLWGTWQGFGWIQVLGEKTQCSFDVCYEGSPETADVFASAVAGGLLGTGIAMLAADANEIDGGTATMIGWGSLWGINAGLVIAVLADLGDDDEPLAAALIGGDAGFAAAAFLAPDWNMSTGRAWLVNAAGVMGTAIGGGLDLIIQPDDEKVAVLIPAIGAAVGLGLGAHLTRDYDEGRIREGMLDPTDASDALVRLRDGEWRVAMPLPAPALLREHPRDAPELGVRVQLLDARF